MSAMNHFLNIEVMEQQNDCKQKKRTAKNSLHSDYCKRYRAFGNR
jgi:hypothetical protein